MTTPLPRPIDTGRDTPDMAWDGWGLPEKRRDLPGPVRQVISHFLHVTEPAPQRPVSGDVALPDSAFDQSRLADVREELTAIVGAEHLHADHESRLLHAGGKSLTDLLTRREATQHAPDAVVRPADHDEVQAVLELCSRRRIAIVPFGGGTSVVGGVTPGPLGEFAAVISLDTGRLTALYELDELSMTATLGAGLSGPAAERLLRSRGYILGHYPQSFEHATLGGFAASRSSGQASCGYGRFDAMVERVRLATPSGTLDLGRAPASAAGPDLRQLVLGSEGAFGVITALTLRLHPVPRHTAYEAWTFRTFEDGADAVRLIAQSELRPTVLRLSDETETRINYAMAGDMLKAAKRRCVMITTFDAASKADAELRRKWVAKIAKSRGGRSLGPTLAREWEAGRYRAPYVRDPALDTGVLVETFETATSWSGIVPLWRDVARAVTDALAPAKGRAMVWAHISHQYPSGASLYFTAAAPAGSQPIELWAKAKRAAGDVIVAHGATITHHHAIGRDHLPWLEAEIGALGIDVLRAVKQRLDPAGVCNPGALIPPD